MQCFFVVRRAPKAAALSPFRFPPLTICPKNTNHPRKKYLSFINESHTDIMYIGYSCLMFTEVYSFTHLFSGTVSDSADHFTQKPKVSSGLKLRPRFQLNTAIQNNTNIKCNKYAINTNYNYKSVTILDTVH